MSEDATGPRSDRVTAENVDALRPDRVTRENVDALRADRVTTENVLPRRPDRVTTENPGAPRPDRLTRENTAAPDRAEDARQPDRTTRENTADDPTGEEPPPPDDAGFADRLPASIDEHVTDLELLDRQGGQATLYRATWDGREQVVVKVFRNERPQAPQLWNLWGFAGGHDRFVVRLLMGHNEWRHDYEVTEFHELGSLRSHLGDGPVSPEVAREVLVEVAEALDYIHHRLPAAHSSAIRTLVHGDVKPDNVLVVQADPLRLCLTDFGIARVQEYTRERAAGEMTPEYAAPEVFRRECSPAVDWWSLGMTLLELLQGRHPFHVGGEWLSEEAIGRLVNDEPVPIDDTLPERWRLLLRGLLTWSAEHRWDHRQVRAWLDGATPAINAGIGPTEPQGEPFLFGRTEVHRPRQLAAALAADWSAAGHLVLGSWERLLVWAAGVSPELHDSLDEVRRHYVQEGRSVDLCVCELIVRLDRDAAPQFQRFRVDEVGLYELAVAAETDGEANRVLTVLHDSGSLRALSRLTGQGRLDLVDEQWRRWCALSRSHLDAVARAHREVPATDRLPGVLLRAAIDQDYADTLSARAESLDTGPRRRHVWFQDLVDAAVAPDSPPADAVIVLAAVLADEPRRRLPAVTQTGLGEQTRTLRAQIDRDIRNTNPGPDPRAVRVRSATPPARPRRWLVGIAVVAGCLLLTSVAGVGVAARTSTVEGVLTAAFVAVACACLAIGLARPPSRLSNALLGGFVATATGLLVAVGVAAATDWLLGPRTAWPVFWAGWVLCVATGVAWGASERTDQEDVWQRNRK